MQPPHNPVLSLQDPVLSSFPLWTLLAIEGLMHWCRRDCWRQAAGVNPQVSSQELRTCVRGPVDRLNSSRVTLCFQRDNRLRHRRKGYNGGALLELKTVASVTSSTDLLASVWPAFRADSSCAVPAGVWPRDSAAWPLPDANPAAIKIQLGVHLERAQLPTPRCNVHTMITCHAFAHTPAQVAAGIATAEAAGAMAAGNENRATHKQHKAAQKKLKDRCRQPTTLRVRHREGWGGITLCAVTVSSCGTAGCCPWRAARAQGDVRRKLLVATHAAKTMAKQVGYRLHITLRSLIRSLK